MTFLVREVGPQVSLQDVGRPGQLGLGLSRGGAVDRQAYLAALALMNAPLGAAALEMGGFGGVFVFESAASFALTGAAMRAELNGAPLAAYATHLAKPGDVLRIGASERGVYGYLLVGAGFEAPEVLGGRGYHQIAALGARVAAGDRLAFAPGLGGDARALDLAVGNKPLRLMPGPQTGLFSTEEQVRFAKTVFVRSARANRQGVGLEGGRFEAGTQLSQVSDFICEGDVQMTGQGTPYVLLADCQTMGGYPRIGTVLPCDLPRLAQAGPGEEVRFEWVSMEQAEALWQSDETLLAALAARCRARVRDPREMADLLRYELIGKPFEG